jgi:hypothetical protein
LFFSVALTQMDLTLLAVLFSAASFAFMLLDTGIG